jgi:hypothetical protein
MRAPMLFSSGYKSFYCQFSEPSYVKKLKLEMLTAIANESNTYEIGMSYIQLPTVICVIVFLQLPLFFNRFLSPVTELCEYAGNVDVPIARVYQGSWENSTAVV